MKKMQKFNSAASRLMFNEAQKMGIVCNLLPDNNTIKMNYKNFNWFTRGSRTSLQSSIGKTIADDKKLTKIFLNNIGVPTANHVVIKKDTPLDRLNNLKKPWVCKPLYGLHGKGVVTDIETIHQIEEIRLNSNEDLIVEETLIGNEYRVLCVDFKVVAVALRKSAYVIGDGESKIHELIHQKNSSNDRGEGIENQLVRIMIDNDLEKCLQKQQLNLNSVVSSGKEVYLKSTSNLSTGGETWNVIEELSLVNRRLFENLARETDLNIIGIDLKCDNLHKRISDQKNAGVIEINASPGLRIHHYPIKGVPVNVAKLILEMVINKKERYEN